MRISNPSSVTSYKFYLIDPNGDEVAIPASGNLSNKQRLVNQVLSYINMYDNITQQEYSKEQRALAAEAGQPFDEYIGLLVEHQMCLRQRAIKCFNDGIGDKIHEVMGKVDGFVEKAPPVVRKVIESVFAAVTPSHSKSLGGCGACGGSRIMNPRSNNLGRAGKLNRFLK